MRHLARFRMAAAFVIVTVSPIPLSQLYAQGGIGGGIGGVGGGMGGGMGGGTSGRSGGGRNGGSGIDRGPGGSGRERSPAAAVKETLKRDDQIAFMLDHKKPLKLTNAQSDTLKVLRKEMLYTQEPLFSDIDKVARDLPRGGRGGGGRGDEGERGQAGDTLRTLISRLHDIQEVYRDRARARLDATQLHLTDSLQTAWLAERRDKEQRNNRGGR